MLFAIIMFNDRPDPAKRLESARISKGFKTAKDAARFHGWIYETYIQHEQGTRGITRAAGKYAKAFKVSEGWLLTGEGQGPLGKIGAQNWREILRRATTAATGAGASNLDIMTEITRLLKEIENESPEDMKRVSEVSRRILEMNGNDDDKGT